jgi:alcohol dehydrogenase (NADP+)
VGTMPAIGLGTFGSDHVSAAEVAEVVKGAAAAGYRHFDCASVYGNEAEIGASFEEILCRRHRREELWITSKLWNDKHGEDDVIASCRNRSPICASTISTLPRALAVPQLPSAGLRRDFALSRRQALHPRKLHEDLAQDGRTGGHGLVRHIGTSNMTIPKLKLVLRDARIKPAVNEMELHPHFQQPELFNSCSTTACSPSATAPSARRDGRSATAPRRTPRPPRIPVIAQIAERHGIHPAVVCIKWAVQRGQTPIPFSVNHYRANLEGVVGDPLTDEEMRAIAAIDRNCRLIKGQVFLWKDGQTWEDLWDMNGEITPP